MNDNTELFSFSIQSLHRRRAAAGTALILGRLHLDYSTHVSALHWSFPASFGWCPILSFLHCIPGFDFQFRLIVDLVQFLLPLIYAKTILINI